MAVAAEEPTNPTSDQRATPDGWPIEVRPNGTVLYDGIAIGGLDLTEPPAGTSIEITGVPRLTLNLGWMRLAGLGIRVQSDPDVDRNRNGLVLER